MMRRIAVSALLCSLTAATAQSARAQSGSMSDVSGATVNLFSRGIVRAFGAPPAPPPTLIVNAPLLDALCLERSDAMLRLATLSSAAQTAPERSVLSLVRGGAAADEAGKNLSAALLTAGARGVDVEALVSALSGLLASQPQVVNVAAAVERYNALVRNAPDDFLLSPPAEFAVLRLVLGRLTAAANHAYDVERTYPGLETAGIHYGNNAEWLLQGASIEVGTDTYKQYGQTISPGERSYRHLTDYQGVWIVAEASAEAAPPVVYVVLRKYCDIELMPYVLEQKVTKGLSFLSWL